MSPVRSADETDAETGIGGAVPRGEREAGERGEGGERGERGGRGRGRGRDRQRREPEATPQGLGDGALAEAAAAEVAAPLLASSPTPSAAAIPVSQQEQEVAAPTAFAAAAQVVEPASEAEPRVPAADSRVEIEAFELPVGSLQEVARSAGLEWVNSDAEKIRAAQAALENELAPVRVPRERKPAARVDEGPLVLVETRKDLSQYKLPFETAAQEAPAREP
jgi:ribonuclease E